ncbi:MAG: ABC transporter permease [Candidatus Omnitrophota bacterium]
MIKKAFAIAAKEWGTYFKSPMAYIILIISISVFNVFFFMIIDQNREASLRDMFKLMEFIFVFTIPLLTMKVFAEEKRQGTFEFLLTSPISNTTIVLGKYLGTLLFFTSLIFATFIYYIIIEYFGQPDRWAVLAGYFGIWLEGALFIAVGILISSWTANQIIAAIISYAVLLTLYLSAVFVKYADPVTAEIIRNISFWSRTEYFSSGLVQSSDLIYYVTSIGFCLFLTRLSIENRLWK